MIKFVRLSFKNSISFLKAFIYANAELVQSTLSSYYINGNFQCNYKLQ